MNKLRKGDEVIVITGKDKDKKGTITDIIGDKLLVEGINMVKKNVKANPNSGERGGIEMKALPIHRSNVKILAPNGKGSRVGIRILDDGRKVRYFKSTNEVVDAGV